MIAYLMSLLRSCDVPVASAFANVLAAIDIPEVPAVVMVADAPIVGNILSATGVSIDSGALAFVGFPDVVGVP